MGVFGVGVVLVGLVGVIVGVFYMISFNMVLEIGVMVFVVVVVGGFGFFGGVMLVLLLIGLMMLLVVGIDCSLVDFFVFVGVGVWVEGVGGLFMF